MSTKLTIVTPIVGVKVEIKVMKKAESVTLIKKSLSMSIGEKDFITFTLQPEDSNDTVRWYSTDEKIAVVRCSVSIRWEHRSPTCSSQVKASSCPASRASL